jgi:hypothetical protein
MLLLIAPWVQNESRRVHVLRVLGFGDPCPVTSLILFTLRDVLCTYADKRKKGESVLTTLAIAKV